MNERQGEPVRRSNSGVPATQAWLAMLNGALIPYAEAAIPIWDYGFTMGITLTERLRTFGGQLPLIERHLDRLCRAADRLELAGCLRDSLADHVRQVVACNRNQINPESDLAVGICLTPGTMLSAAPPGVPDRAVGMTTELVTATEIEFGPIAHGFQQGTALTVVEIQEISPASIPKYIKHRNRLHYFLAEQQAALRFPGSRALLLDQDGQVAEATTGSVVLVVGDQLIAPPKANVLPSVSFDFASQHLPAAGLSLRRRPFGPDEMRHADEVLWFSTSTLVQPVTSIDGHPLGEGTPGPAFRQLVDAIGAAIGFDFYGQAIQQAAR